MQPSHHAFPLIPLWQQGPWTWESVQSADRVRELFSKHFADAFGGREITEAEAEALVQQRAATGGYTTVCSSLHVGGSVVLLGDAAHSCLASLGQGCNTALESVAAFDAALRSSGGDLGRALPSFTEARKPDVDAIGRLSQAGMAGARARLWPETPRPHHDQKKSAA